MNAIIVIELLGREIMHYDGVREIDYDGSRIKWVLSGGETHVVDLVHVKRFSIL